MTLQRFRDSLPESQRLLFDILGDGYKHSTAQLIVATHMTSAPQQLYKLRAALELAGLGEIRNERAGEKARQDRYWLVLTRRETSPVVGAQAVMAL